ncbi:MAG TPA: peptide chain release factor 1 [Candidatus Latescibacteria bacterium]|nr:peptide chain release factor 1 [Candidatus Latescibacterota bacterium]
MLEALEQMEKRWFQIEGLLSDPEVVSDHERYRELAREHDTLREAVSLYQEYRAIAKGLEEAEGIIKNPEEEADAELIALAKGEIEELLARKRAILQRLRDLLIPRDPNEGRNTVVEIRAGTGGEEASLFAADLFRMYLRYAEHQGWKVEPLSSTPTDVGGFKEIIFLVSGEGAYGKLKYESGVHRVQRVPITESSGRIHTSAASVAVLPEADEVDVKIDPDDLRIDVFRSSGPGGQSVNTADSAVRITHIPTGLVVQCQDERSQHKNKAKALKVLRARLLDMVQSEQQEKISRARRRQVGSGDRSAKIRTYNFPQGRVTDHRINLTLHRLEQILEGDLNELIDALQSADRMEREEESPVNFR